MPLLTELKFAPIAGKPGEYELLDDLVYDHGGGLWIAPLGFRTDLASVPRVFHWLFPPDGDYAPAAVIHDWLYIERPGDLTRKEADDAMLLVMADLGVCFGKRWLIHKAVRLGGWWYWNQH